MGRYFIRKKVRSIFLRSGLQLFLVNKKKKKKKDVHTNEKEKGKLIPTMIHAAKFAELQRAFEKKKKSEAAGIF